MVRRLRGRSFVEHLTPIIGGSSLCRIVLALLPPVSLPVPTAVPSTVFLPAALCHALPFSTIEHSSATCDRPRLSPKL